jgi:hypothetical protein
MLARLRISVASVAACLLLPLAAHAGIVYQFTAFSAFPVGDGVTYTGSFTLEVPDFVGADTTFGPSALASCTVLRNGAPVAGCGSQLFRSDESNAFVGFGPNATTQIAYYFNPGAFNATGTYDTVLFGADQRGRLVVSRSGGTPSVPEPATLALLGAALAGLAFARRRVN